MTLTAYATCTLYSPNSEDELAHATADFLFNHPDDFPDALSDVYEECVAEIASYLRCSGTTLTIRFVNESWEGSWSLDVFDFLVSHFACLQASFCMTVKWITLDDNSDLHCCVNYIDRQGACIDIDSILESITNGAHP